ncbi:TetR family transcriptional regulator [Tsukamurella sp. M9C]|uniref:TetR/AcrR family transcriptional regulator n=1 Tax=unclassified Tsukamurella TaxID=2633480 RepID=UPI001CCD4B1B|nr:TetR family transcriptional regulator [Tsukamurella sp. M9C]MCA0155922.1 TetR family transcriptional regulator [Tsukamurella sp. M9C]
MDERRTAIGEAALDLAAEGGNRAVTHGAVDKRLGLPKGSTSYYCRTRSDLLRTAIEHLRQRSRAAFDADVPRTVDRDTAADVTARQLHHLLTDRRRDSLARYALAPDAQAEGLEADLATCLFSVPLATGLFAALGTVDPDRAAADLVSLLEGLLFDRLYGARSLGPAKAEAESLADLRGPIRRALNYGA